MICQYLRAAVLALSIDGCLPVCDLADEREPAEAPELEREPAEAPAPEMEPAESRAFETFSPSPEALPYVPRALEVWSAATGRVLEIGEGGVRVELVPQVFLLADPEQEVCARTEMVWDSLTGSFLRNSTIEIAAAPGIACPSLQCAINHEIGHAVAQPNRSDEMHAEDGALMAASLPADEDCPLPDVRDLAVVCHRAPCD